MRHHGGPDDAEGEIEHGRIADDIDGRGEAENDAPPIGIGERNLDDETGEDHRQERDDEGLDPAEAQLLEPEDEEDVEGGDDDAELEWHPEQEIEADRRSHHLGDVGGDDGDLGEKPEHRRDGPREGIAAGLGEVAAGTDGEPGAERLQDDCHDVGEERHEQQRIAELGAAGDRGRPIARVHIADGDKIAGADKGDGPPPQAAGRGNADRPEDIGQRRLTGGPAPTPCPFGVHGFGGH